MDAKERATIIRKRLNEYRKTSMRALIDLHGGASRGAARTALREISAAVKIASKRLIHVRTGQASLTEPELGRLNAHLANYRETWRDDEFMLQLIDQIDTSTFGEPADELVILWLEGALQGTDLPVEEGEGVSCAPTSFSVAEQNVPRDPFAVLLTSKGTSFITLPEGSIGEMTFNRAALVEEIRIAAQ